MNLIVALSISISICLLIALLLILVFIIPNLLGTATGPQLSSSTSSLALLHLDGLLLVSRNLILIFLVRETTYATVRYIRIKARIKT